MNKGGSMTENSKKLDEHVLEVHDVHISMQEFCDAIDARAQVRFSQQQMKEETNHG